MSKTAKEMMEEARQAWHIERAADKILRDQYVQLCDEMREQKLKTHQAHNRYKEEKAIWRTARDFNVTGTDARQAAILHKLRKPL